MKSNFFYLVAALVDLISFFCYKTNKHKISESNGTLVNTSVAGGEKEKT
jgi:hypothetical protein